LSAGLDREDEVVRRRVAQRMASLNEGMAAAVPQDAELQAWLRTHPAAYRIAPRYTLQQVYFDPRRRGARLQGDIDAARALLAHDADASPGDATLLPAEVDDTAAEDLAALFGSAFVHALGRAPLGEWSGPIASGYGMHLVRVEARTPARMPPLAEVRDDVERDWLRDRTQRADHAYLAALRKHYTVDIDADLAQSIAENVKRLAADGAPVMRWPIRCIVLFLILGTWFGIAHADTFRPAYFELRQVDAERYDVLWKLPALDRSTPMAMHVRFPEGTRVEAAPRSAFTG
jgi:hypothetical protein